MDVVGRATRRGAGFGSLATGPGIADGTLLGGAESGAIASDDTRDSANGCTFDEEIDATEGPVVIAGAGGTADGDGALMAPTGDAWTSGVPDVDKCRVAA